jgi:deazaflavin-dependent oxidoreductase (nitroreductase family)
VRNPFTGSARGGRILSNLQLPVFKLRPPPDYGVLTTTGRKTGRKRQRCVRAVRRGDRAYVVAIKGGRTGWAGNALANPEVALRIRDGRFTGRAREVAPGERDQAREAYAEGVHRFERLEYRLWRNDRPDVERIRDLHRHWFDTGMPLVIELTAE